MRRFILKSAEDIPTVLREGRMDRGCSRRQVAQEVGITGQMVSLCESGKRIPHVPALIRLLDALGYELWVVKR